MEGALHASFDCGTDPTDAAFCDPNTGLVACGTMGGKVLLFSLGGPPGSNASSALVKTFNLNEHHSVDNKLDEMDGGEDDAADGGREIAVRALDIVDGGRGIGAGMHDSSLCMIDIESGAILRRMFPDLEPDVEKKDHAVSRVLCLEEIFGNGHVIVSGDESGTVALWDARCSGNSNPSSSPVFQISPHDDYISDIIVAPGKKGILTTSGDGTLCLIDVRMRHGGGYAMKMKHRTEEDADDELLSVATVRAGQKVVCGTTSGVLNIYSCGAWNDCSDRFPGHPDSVTSVIAIDEETVLTGSSDGLIRIVNIQPNTFLGVLGEHSDFDIERLVMRHDKAFLASVSHDPILKIWNTRLLLDDDDDDDEDDNNDSGDDAEGTRAGQPSARPPSKGDDTEHTTENTDDAENTDDTEDGDAGSSKRRKKKRNKGAHKIPRKSQQTAKTASANFFSDLL